MRYLKLFFLPPVNRSTNRKSRVEIPMEKTRNIKLEISLGYYFPVTQQPTKMGKLQF